MTTVRRKSTPSAEGQPGQTSQPAWRQPPPKLRRKDNQDRRLSLPGASLHPRNVPKSGATLR
jgi:hypothetical protein